MNKENQGRVMRSTGSYYTVINQKGELVECTLKGKFRLKGIRSTNPIAVGDLVTILPSEADNTGVITDIEERTNYIIRRSTNLSKASHIIAANLDQAVLIVSLVKPSTSTGFIDRFLVTSEAYHIPAIIVFNKIDLYGGSLLEVVDSYCSIYQNAGYKCLTTSVPDNIGMIEFGNILNNKVTLLSGHSGVGKSALINKIDPKLRLREGNISDYHQKGKHTTTFAEMFVLSNGGCIIDTPGIKEFGLVGFELTELGQRFPEIRNRMHLCRFNNCLHVNEPGCAVLADFEKGLISESRYGNYLNMLDELSEERN